MNCVFAFKTSVRSGPRSGSVRCNASRATAAGAPGRAQASLGPIRQSVIGEFPLGLTKGGQIADREGVELYVDGSARRDAALRKSADDRAVLDHPLIAGHPGLPRLSRLAKRCWKALLAEAGCEYPRTHNLAVLEQLAARNDQALPAPPLPLPCRLRPCRKRRHGVFCDPKWRHRH
jgi:hypothetical protein